MNLITINVRHPHIDDISYEQTIDIEKIVSFYDSLETTRISLINGEYLNTVKPIGRMLKEYFRKNNIKIIKLGD